MNLISGQEAMEVLTDPSIWPNISDIPHDQFEPPDNCLYLSITGNDVFILEPDGTIHANVLPRERARSAELGFIATKWFFDHTDHQVIKSSIPKNYQNAINYAKKCGYELQDNGDQVIVTAERSKWDLSVN